MPRHDPRHVCPQCRVYDPTALVHYEECPRHRPATGWWVRWAGDWLPATLVTPALVAGRWRRQAPRVHGPDGESALSSLVRG